MLKKTAVLLTCYNRKEKTIICLKSLHKAIDITNAEIKFDIFLVDDGSTDGTSEEVLKHFPEINLINGSGELYWARGMRLAWESAIKMNHDYDAFLLLNDDVTLTDSFLNDLLITHKYCLEHFNQPGIYVGSTRDPINSKLSYGGSSVKCNGIWINTSKINPSNIPKPCSIANANILMVSIDVVKKIGILDPKYIHRFADHDYTLRASRNGIPVLVCPGYSGICVNDHNKSWLSNNSSLKDRLKYLRSPLGLAYKEQLYYLKKNFKYQLPYYFIMLWLKTLFPFLWDKFKN